MEEDDDDDDENNPLYNVEFSFVKVCIHFFWRTCIYIYIYIYISALVGVCTLHKAT